MAVASAQAAPILSLVATPTPIEAGTSFQLDVHISDATDLYGWQFDLDFTPALLSAADATEGSFLASAGSTFFIAGLTDNVTGTSLGTANTLLGAISGVDGTGILASFVFSALNSGSASFALSNVLLLDSAFNEVSAEIQGLSLNIESTVPPVGVPEPGPMGLGVLAIGLLAVAVRTRRRHAR